MLSHLGCPATWLHSTWPQTRLNLSQWSQPPPSVITLIFLQLLTVVDAENCFSLSWHDWNKSELDWWGMPQICWSNVTVALVPFHVVHASNRLSGTTHNDRESSILVLWHTLCSLLRHTVSSLVHLDFSSLNTLCLWSLQQVKFAPIFVRYVLFVHYD
jgi:hypothetical protein